MIIFSVPWYSRFSNKCLKVKSQRICKMDQHFKIRKLWKVENYDGVGMIKNTIQTVRPMSYFGFWNPGNFCLWNPGLWNPSHGIRNPTNDWNLDSKIHCQEIQKLSKTWNREFKTLKSPHMGQNSSLPRRCSYIFHHILWEGTKYKLPSNDWVGGYQNSSELK